eukprot:jgi/Picsp_1/6551/NSC_03894-R1_protein
MADLQSYIDWSAVEAVNCKAQSAANALKQGYRDDNKLVLETDTDSQLLLHVSFKHPVKSISGIQIQSQTSPDQAPKSIKLFVNRRTIGFGDAMDSPATMTLELNNEDLNGDKIIPLPIVRFRNVSCLTIFAEENQAEDNDLATKIEKIVVIGYAGDKMDVSSIKDVSKDQ